ncbi:MAG: exo-beta-N-acetylmuramidase NamZ family protein [Turicibacter sp.]
MLCGIDNLSQYDHVLKGKKLALITNPTGVNKELKSSIDVLNEDYNLTLLFSPEHGVRGDKQAGEHVDTYIDERSGIEVFSIYGSSHSIPDSLNDKYDVLIYDIQDTGSRFYTYISTLLNCLRSCAKNNKPMIVLDRPNPIGGNIVEGNILETSVKSFVGCFKMPQRYGLTSGEFAMMANDLEQIGCDLLVVKMDGYNREMFFDETGLLFINPSPNIPSLEAEVLYNGTCLFEGTCLSEGRGTTKPFEIVGAPWIDGTELANIMNAKNLAGVIFRPTFFVPTFSKHQGQMCQGVQIHVTDKKVVRAVEVGLYLLEEAKKMTTDQDFFISPPFESDALFIDKLAGTKSLRLQPTAADVLIEKYRLESEQFKNKKEMYHLY